MQRGCRLRDRLAERRVQYARTALRISRTQMFNNKPCPWALFHPSCHDVQANVVQINHEFSPPHLLKPSNDQGFRCVRAKVRPYARNQAQLLKLVKVFGIACNSRLAAAHCRRWLCNNSANLGGCRWCRCRCRCYPSCFFQPVVVRCVNLTENDRINVKDWLGGRCKVRPGPIAETRRGARAVCWRRRLGREKAEGVGASELKMQTGGGQRTLARVGSATLIQDQ